MGNLNISPTHLPPLFTPEKDTTKRPFHFTTLYSNISYICPYPSARVFLSIVTHFRIGCKVMKEIYNLKSVMLSALRVSVNCLDMSIFTTLAAFWGFNVAHGEPPFNINEPSIYNRCHSNKGKCFTNAHSCSRKSKCHCVVLWKGRSICIRILTYPTLEY